jgi:hypothetical protein
MATALGFAVLVGGCVLSTDAVIADSVATLDDRLLGTWKEHDGEDSAVVTRDSGNAYRIAYSSALGTGTFAGRLGRLGGRTVMDFSPTPRKSELPEAYENYLLPLHVLLTVDLAADTLRIATLDCDSLRAALQAGRVRLGYGEVGNRVMLFATGEQFRQAIAPHLTAPGSLTRQATWRKVPKAAISPNGP